MPEESVDPAQHELFARLWTTVQGTVAAYVHATIRDRAAADDAVQEVAIIAMRKFDRFDQDRSFTAWVLGIARYQVLHAMRGIARDRHLLTPELASTLAEEAAEMTEDLQQERHHMMSCLEAVAGRSRQALRLRYEEGLDAPTIGERLSMKANAVRIMLHRVRGKLEKCIRRKMAAGGGA